MRIKFDIRQMVLFIMFVGFSIGSVALITATFYVAPMTIYLPYRTEPIMISSSSLAAIMAFGAIVSFLLLLETVRKK